MQNNGNSPTDAIHGGEPEMTMQTNLSIDPALLPRLTGPAAVPAPVSNNRHSFEQALSGVMKPTEASKPSDAAREFTTLAENPYLKNLMAANGGYGLQAFMTSSGFLDGDASLQDLVARLAELTTVRPGGGRLDTLGRGGAMRRHTGAVTAGGHGRHQAAASSGPDLTSLSSQFESGSLGSAAIGYDSTGGTSYGIYQIASKTGTMNDFLEFLDQRAPDISKRLRAAGPANTGGKEGRMPDEWRTMAAESPKRFADLQRDFIRDSHYEPAARAIKEQTGIDVSRQSPVLQEVLWSTAVQHGPAGAARIFAPAMDKAQGQKGKDFDVAVIDEVYSRRATQFGSSTERVRNAVQSRFRQERTLALLMVESQKA